MSRTSTAIQVVMTDGEWHSVGGLTRVLQSTPSTIAYALKRMKDADQVVTKAEGGILWYQIA